MINQKIRAFLLVFVALVISAPDSGRAPAFGTFCLASIVKAEVPPVAIVITSEPLNVIDVLESASPAILSN